MDKQEKKKILLFSFISLVYIGPTQTVNYRQSLMLIKTFLHADKREMAHIPLYSNSYEFSLPCSVKELEK